MDQGTEWLAGDLPATLPVLMLKSRVLFPLQVLSALVAMKANLRLLEDHIRPETIVAAGVFLNPDGGIQRGNLCPTAVACRVLSRVKKGSGTTQVVLQGLERVALAELVATQPYFTGRFERLPESGQDAPQVRDLVDRVLKLVRDLIEADRRYSQEQVKLVELNRESGSRCADCVAEMIHLGYGEKRLLLETADVPARLEKLAEMLVREIGRAQLVDEVQVKTRISLDREQRMIFLREQLAIIRRELDEMDPAEAELSELAARVKSANLPAAVAEEALREIQRLRDSEIRAHEGYSIRAYVDWVLSMPWNVRTKDRYNLTRARRILDRHYLGLGNARERLLQFLAVRRLGGHSGRPLLAILGPPGSGRSSLGGSVGEILGRPFIRISMRGVRDEAQLRGRARGELAARPGRILDAVRRAGVRNPVILFEGIGQLEEGEGDPLLALQEALDPTRNSLFYDHFLGVLFDLSEVLFIVTANIAEDIPEALLDFVHVIELPGYTEELKMSIARERLWPDVKKGHGLADRSLEISDAALECIIHRYTREAGVHHLKAQLEAICRRIAVEFASGRTRRVAVTIKNLETYLGKPLFPAAGDTRKPQIGAAMGLAYTDAGGDLLPIEALLMPGSGKIMITGLLGEMMQESVSAALSYVRSRAEELGIPKDPLKGKDLHVHFPEGAIPKDGPSAGITVATTIASLLSGSPVRSDIAMTGEISLRGWVLPVGGIREKVLAAFRAGIKQVILPKDNENDLKELPAEVRSRIKVHLVAEVVEVFRIALLKPAAPPARR